MSEAWRLDWLPISSSDFYSGNIFNENTILATGIEGQTIELYELWIIAKGYGTSE